MTDDALLAYYALDGERDRLAAGFGRVEYLRTVEVIGRTLPPSGTVADIGGGPGRYTDWLVSRGHRVEHRDIVAHHVDQVRARYGGDDRRVRALVADARSLDLADGCVDAALVLGPLYHLRDPADRARALAEAARIVVPGGPVYVAAISRWAARLDAILVKRLDRENPRLLELIDEVERTGVLPPVGPASFTAYVHRPDELAGEVTAAGLELESLVGLEGPAGLLGDLDRRLDDHDGRATILATLRALEAVPELLGVSGHLLATARRPG